MTANVPFTGSTKSPQQLPTQSSHGKHELQSARQSRPMHNKRHKHLAPILSSSAHHGTKPLFSPKRQSATKQAGNRPHLCPVSTGQALAILLTTAEHRNLAHFRNSLATSWRLGLQAASTYQLVSSLPRPKPHKATGRAARRQRTNACGRHRTKGRRATLRIVRRRHRQYALTARP